ncbi:metallophosphoesterase [Lentilactobacillus otakiensis]|uniref:Phosphoesterase n=1 Tax=Lentilactobacillus otakiensis DSM 19908 = JCM 15040 TaxID=1423780 RepID=S4NPH1_9LACO|nr:metallophosphoesterase [Lentilactobacillus otakiensis]KRL09052.1 phosphodiesterase [Lentilactobacillus otakiensis DSM 19908 = JCM 15040]MBZ3775667.1 metallophosphoesterase [Lentilactobacillus otakiensis]MDV3518886.1 metallophosphoesterase [Lentilactobacillus otakiensis]GAD15953.1 phosphodiesterase [Lentilactobacillus otakiensis DSM 19908 = JCM 15040]
MKILVVSDSHGDRKIIQQLVDRYDGQVDGIFHCGDSELSLDDPLIAKMHIVQGNMDFAEFPDHELEKIDHQTILVTHGHHQNVNGGLLNLELYARSLSANIVLFGHTHQLGVTFDDNILFVNPGSISQPRGEYAPLGGTYAMVSSNDQQYTIQYYNREFQPIDNLKFSFTS